MRYAIITLFLFATALVAQPPTPQTTMGGPTSVPPGTTVVEKDSNGDTGASVSNNGNHGKLTIYYDGKLERNNNGEWILKGKIKKVVNKQEHGANGPIVVNTDGEPMEVVLERDGPGTDIEVGISGGKADIKIEGDHNDVTINGEGNKVTVTGDDNSITTNQGSGGSCSLQGSGNSISGVGLGGWTVTN